MKTKFTIVLAFMVSICFSQTKSINYKALIKDNNGDVIANTAIQVHFAILQGATEVYREYHAPTTDANGIVILNIGGGNIVSGDYSTINWAADDHFLNVQIDTGSGLTDMGTTEFKAVPYAHNAANVSGLEKIFENTYGWRLIGRDPNNYGNIGLNAVDISTSNIISNTNGATGVGSFATGYQTRASGNYSITSGWASQASNANSVAMGYYNIASGEGAVAMGQNNTASATSAVAIGDANTASGAYSTAIGSSSVASGIQSTAMGAGTIASGGESTAIGLESIANGHASVAMGNRTVASAAKSTSMGSYNIGGGNPTLWVETDPLFEIGNSDDPFNLTNALTILKNGTITAPSFDIAEITDLKALITKEYADANYTGGGSTGLEAIDEGQGIGWRLTGTNPDYYGNVGQDAVDLSLSDEASSTYGATGPYSVALGSGTTASGYNSTTMGRLTTASGFYSTAMGDSSIASGLYSVAIGFTTTASEFSSFAMGYGTVASGKYATAFGLNTIAFGQSSFASGVGTNASGTQSTAMGGGAIASGHTSISIGSQTTASGQNSVALGAFAEATNAYATAIGYQTEASGQSSTALGYDTNAIGNFSTAIGSGTTASGITSTAMGLLTTASGTYSTAMGTNTNATGNYSTTMGVGTTASNDYATAFGSGTTASGSTSTAFGNSTLASAANSTAMGLGTIALTTNSLVIGEYNTNDDLIPHFLFQVGNGTSDLDRLDAFWVAKNGNATLAGILFQNSDIRLKTNIDVLSYGLNDILKLKPVSYNWKKYPEQTKKSLGLIAQDVQPIINEIVTVGHDKDQTLSVSYIELIPVLIKAIQEQQDIINKQDTKINGLTAELEQLKTLDQRIKQLEALTNGQQ